MRTAPTNGGRGVDVENRESLDTPRRPELQADLPEVRRLWWRLAARGDHLPPEPGVIVIDGGRS